MVTNEEIKQKFEKTFDIGFIVQKGTQANGEPWYIVKPDDFHNDLFHVHFDFRNGIRLIMEFIPDAYSVNMVNDMANASAEKKRAFTSYARLLLERNAKIELKINQLLMNVEEVSSWPKVWENISLKVTRSPIVEENMSLDHGFIVQDWGLIMMGMVLSLLDIVPIMDDLDYSNIDKLEGLAHSVISTHYERNPIYRTICISNKGYKCDACGFDFKHTYGNLGSEYIHVHHTTPVSQMSGGMIINPVKDLVPVCPNCHAMLHRKNPPLTIEELREVLSHKPDFIT